MINLIAHILFRALALTVMLGSVGVAAQELNSGLDDYRYAHEMYSSSLKDDDYRLVLGAMEKVNSQWRPEKEQRLEGQLQRKTLLINGGRTAADGYDYYRQQLLKLGARELFRCQARECGSSNSWANAVFHIKQLYGLEQTQFYSAFEWEGEEGVTRYLALYAVTRGNKRSFVQLDTLSSRTRQTIASSADVMAQALRQGRAVALPDIGLRDGVLVIDDAYLAGLLVLIGQQPSWHFNLVGHDSVSGSTSHQLERSKGLAQQLADRLVALGTPTSRLSVFGVGNLAPAVQLDMTKKSYRLEIVKASTM
jgi:hypothetical protein